MWNRSCAELVAFSSVRDYFNIPTVRKKYKLVIFDELFVTHGNFSKHKLTLPFPVRYCITSENIRLVCVFERRVDHDLHLSLIGREFEKMRQSMMSSVNEMSRSKLAQESTS